MITKLEMFLLKYLGQGIMSLSVAGIVLAAIFDKLTRGLWQTLGWAQIVGILAFGCLYLVGMTVQELHKRLLILVKREEGN